MTRHLYWKDYWHESRCDVTDFCLETRGDYACFTRPELKVERVSYDVMTPSAGRAIFEAILWKPALVWRIQRIEVLKPIRWTSLRRNEVGSKVSTRVVDTMMRRGSGNFGLYVDDDRQQRAALFLRDVGYRIHARLSLSASAGPADSIAKFAEMFRRRATHGQCVNQPYLGTREFDCRFRLVDDPQAEPPPIDETRDLGVMLFDLDFGDRGKATPAFFRASLDRGILRVPDPGSAAVLR